MADNVEFELKFVFPPEALTAVQAALREETKEATARRRLVSHYFDTADDYLWRHAVTLRVRKDGRESIQTIKREKPSTLDRDEFEKLPPKGTHLTSRPFDARPWRGFLEKRRCGTICIAISTLTWNEKLQR